MARIHGDRFLAYRQRVPCWIPGQRRESAPSDHRPPVDADVIIVGGGPVGLLLANLLGKAGRSVLLFEVLPRVPARSMAIGITPPSLDILAQLDLDKTFIEHGIAISTAVVHEQGKVVSCLRFDELPDPFHFILSLPQSETSRLLREKLVSMPSVHVWPGWRVTALEQGRDHVTVRAVSAGNREIRTFTSLFAAGCDGARGDVASWLGIKRIGKNYPPRFVMADYRDTSGLGYQAHLFFGPERPVESFPLPGGRRRWIVRCGWRDQNDLRESMEAVIERLTGVGLNPADKLDESCFQPRHQLARGFYRGRVALCGDAAHVMSPIGGQGMNTGFGDAAFLARTIDAMLDGRSAIAAGMKRYQRHRRRVFRVAAARSALGMRLGVMAGAIASPIRRLLVRRLLGQPCRNYMLRWFTMRSLPYPLEIRSGGNCESS